MDGGIYSPARGKLLNGFLGHELWSGPLFEESSLIEVVAGVG